jgi:hypothetical protein
LEDIDKRIIAITIRMKINRMAGCFIWLSIAASCAHGNETTGSVKGEELN